MHHRVDGIGLKCLSEPFLIGKITQDKEAIPDGFSVPGLKVIIDNGSVALADELLDHMATNVSSPTCD